jgi:hypothetical protein
VSSDAVQAKYNVATCLVMTFIVTAADDEKHPIEAVDDGDRSYTPTCGVTSAIKLENITYAAQCRRKSDQDI